MEKQKKVSLTAFILVLILLLLVCSLLILIIYNDRKESSEKGNENQIMGDVEENKDSPIIADSDGGNTNIENYISKFDISFLKLENEKVNKIYSPLSIKYGLKMLEEGASGETKIQISNVLGNENITKYNPSQNISLANALFIRDTFQNSIKDEYKNTLAQKYNAEVISDTFSSVENVNSWISNKTLNLINDMIQNIDDETNFILVNALGIDMEWENKFLEPIDYECYYYHENYSWMAAEQVRSFNFGEAGQEVSGMEIQATINNYDIVNELGEENIRKIVGTEYKKWAKSLTQNDYEYKYIFNEDLSDKNIEAKLEQYLDGGKYYSDYESKGYISELDSNYKGISKNTDFSLYVDNNVKALAKNLKEYNGTTLQYIAIMPTNEDLDSYIQNTNENEFNRIISNLKELTNENFKEGVVTEITGYIPKFKFEYELALEKDLKESGITNIFEKDKADFSKISDYSGIYIDEAIHKSNIEFTQDGIKAAASTVFGGAGAGDSFDYLFDVPVEKIDLTFDKPYVFFIRDTETGEIWFAGTVYEPLLWENEPEKDSPQNGKE